MGLCTFSQCNHTNGPKLGLFSLPRNSLLVVPLCSKQWNIHSGLGSFSPLSSLFLPSKHRFPLFPVGDFGPGISRGRHPSAGSLANISTPEGVPWKSKQHHKKKGRAFVWLFKQGVLSFVCRLKLYITFLALELRLQVGRISGWR